MVFQLQPQLKIFITHNIYSPTISHMDQTIHPPSPPTHPKKQIQHTTSCSYFGTTLRTGHEILHVQLANAETHYHNLNANIKHQVYWLITSNVGIKIQEALNCSTGLLSHILGTSSLQNCKKWKPLSAIHHQIPSHGYLLTEGPQLTFLKLFYKQVRNHDKARGQREISKNTEWKISSVPE